MDLQITGTAGIILKAGLDGKLNIEETIIQLEDVGFRLSNEVKEHLLRKSKANK
jgi:predicted nucleic acid-binding protein